MPTPAVSSLRLFANGTPLQNRLLAALPAAAYARLQKSSRSALCAMRHRHRCQSVTVSNLQDTEENS